MTAAHYDAQLRAAFHSLTGRHITGWHGEQMALRDEGPDGNPVFEDPDLPLLQCTHLTATLDQDDSTTFTTDQHGSTWALATRQPPARPHADQGIYRARALTLPTGRVDRVTLFEDSEHVDLAGLVAEVLLAVSGRHVLLVAGEIYEGWNGQLTLARPDESVLVFADPATALQLPWRPSRTALRVLDQPPGALHSHPDLLFPDRLGNDPTNQAADQR